MSTDYIEINGKKYDTNGRLVASNTDDNNSTPVSHQIIKPHSTHNNRHKHTTHKTTNHIQHHHVQKSKTLSRKAVTRSKTNKKPAIKTNKVTESAVSSLTTPSLIRLSTSAISPDRSRRAAQSQKNPRIEKFNRSAPSKPKETTPTKHYPKTGRTFDIAPIKKPGEKPVNHPASDKDIAPDKFMNLVSQRETSTNHRYLETPKPKRAIRSRVKPQHRKMYSIAVIGLAILSFAGVFAYANKTNIKLELAKANSGINASLPAYKPSGYKIADLHYHTGLVTIDYQQNQTSRHFSLIQKASGYATGSALAEITSEGKDNNYRTLSLDGRTVYLSDDDHGPVAVWLDSGILYQIKGNANLGESQIKGIISSIK